MIRSEVISGIRKAWEFSKLLDLGESYTNPAPFEPSDKFRDLALDYDASYEDLYLAGLEYGDYNIQLRDFSFFQFGIAKDNHVRFAYYPNPFLGSSTTAVAEVNELRAFVEEGIVSIEEFLHRVAELRNSQHPPLTRYENAPDDYVEFRHPCSHFHFGHHRDNRWTLQRVLSPLAFALIIFEHYYSDAWHGAGSLSAFGREDFPKGFLASEKLNCRILPSDLYSISEAAAFSFT